MVGCVRIPLVVILTPPFLIVGPPAELFVLLYSRIRRRTTACAQRGPGLPLVRVPQHLNFKTNRRFGYYFDAMTDDERFRQAVEDLRDAYRRQMSGDLEGAITSYRRSIDRYPTAEAHTFLGWTYSFQGRYEDAIGECKRAIAVDPDFGNPYNDIGAYLFELGRLDDAIPWLERALRAERYEPKHFPHCHLGNVYWRKGELVRAEEQFMRALALSPGYEQARVGLEAVRRQLN